MAVAAVGGVAVVALTSIIGGRSRRWFLALLGFVILGYVMQGRRFAYIGFGPIYIGELALGFGMLVAAVSYARWRFGFTHLLMLVFMGIGLARSLPFISKYGMLTVRDAALWWYGMFALVVSLLATREDLLLLARWLARLLPFLLVWTIVMVVVLPHFAGALPTLPGSPLPVLSIVKAGDRAVVLVGLAAFIMSGLYDRLKTFNWLPVPLLWLLWLMSAFLVAIQNRGGMLAIAIGLAVVFILNPSRQWFRFGAIALVAGVLLIIVDPRVEQSGREISIDQLMLNVVSVISDDTANAGGVQGTKDWRISLWTAIVEDTLLGPHALGGRGFGLNLVAEYDATGNVDESVRAPHNTHVTVIGRMGVPGLLAWLGLNLTYLISMIVSLYDARKRRDEFRASFTVFLLAIWAAALVTTAFDPYLEGPQGAIPFWCSIGAGLVLMRSKGGSPSSHHDSGNGYENTSSSQRLSAKGG